MGSENAPDLTNPKDLVGIKKVPLGLMPAAGKIYGALAMVDGGGKYGPYNWREKRVRMSIYLDAIERHLLEIRDGADIDEHEPDCPEDCSKHSGAPHLGHIIACASILADAIEGGQLIDDRPLRGPAKAVLNRFTDSRILQVFSKRVQKWLK